MNLIPRLGNIMLLREGAPICDFLGKQDVFYMQKTSPLCNGEVSF